MRRAGGRALVVGGYVRDRMLSGASGGEPDLEVFGLTARDLERALRPLGRIHRVGRAFPVLRIGGLAVEVALPRRESKTGPGHLGFAVQADPFMSFAEAAGRRDLTLNSIGLDPLTGEVLDPCGGVRDLTGRRMRATDPARFGEDPLRALRVAAFASRFGFTADEALARLCAGLDLAELSPERIFDELSKLLSGRSPSLGFRFLADTGLLRFLPEVDALRRAPRDPERPEVDALDPTLAALDHAAGAAPEDPGERQVFRWAVLCRDLGGPSATGRRADDAPAPARDTAGAASARRFLERLRAPRALVEAVEALTRWRSAVASLGRRDGARAAYRQLARDLAAAGVNLEMLLRVAAAHRAGRGRFPEGEAFRERALDLGVFRSAPTDAVTGRHVLARDIAPGKAVGRILARCRELEDEGVETDPERLLDRALAEMDRGTTQRRPPA